MTERYSAFNLLREAMRGHKGWRPAWRMPDPNAIMNVRLGDVARPNCLASTTLLEDGKDLRAVNAFPDARLDIKGGLDMFHRLLPAGFYYKMFMWPDWHLFEPTIRKMAGLGHLEGAALADFEANQTHDSSDLLVVGGGAAGLAAAAGQSVVLVDDHVDLGGSLFQMGEIEGQQPADWVAKMRARIEASLNRGSTTCGHRVLKSTPWKLHMTCPKPLPRVR